MMKNVVLPRLRAIAAILLAIGMSRSLCAADELLIADFEGTDYAGWTTSGTAFGSGPASGAIGGKQKAEGYAGNRLVNSFFGGGDEAVVTLHSPEFTITRPDTSFLIGGGNHPKTTCINLYVQGKVIATATGADAEHLDRLDTTSLSTLPIGRTAAGNLRWKCSI